MVIFNLKRHFVKILILGLFIFSTPLIFSQQKKDALKLYNIGNYTEAIKVCEQEIQANPQNMDAYTVLCWSLVQNKQYSEAELRASNARKISRYDHRITEILAEAKYHLGLNDDALSLFQEYISLVSTTGSRLGVAYFYSGEIFILKAKFQHADIALTQAVYIEPLRENWWVRLGYAREMTKNYRSSAEAYQKALDLNPSLNDAIRGKNRVMAFVN